MTGTNRFYLAMGVRRAFHRQGIGRALLQRAKAAARAKGYSFLQVKTVQMGRYAAYDRTNRFYLAMGFREFEVFPDLWDKWNPCQVYVMALRAPGGRGGCENGITVQNRADFADIYGDFARTRALGLTPRRGLCIIGKVLWTFVQVRKGVPLFLLSILKKRQTHGCGRF